MVDKYTTTAPDNFDIEERTGRLIVALDKRLKKCAPT